MVIQILYHKGYRGTILISEYDGIFYGKVLDIGNLVSYEGYTLTELITNFEQAIDDYIETCIYG